MMKNELYDGGIYNVTDDWRASHFRTYEIMGYEIGTTAGAVAVCPLYRKHCCFPTCMYHVVAADGKEECFCRYARKTDDCFNGD